MKKIQMMSIKYNDLKINQRDTAKIRGYFGNKYKDIKEMHNHNEDKFIYKYPLIQYKTLENTPTIIGIEQGANILHNNNVYLEFDNVEVIYSKKEFGVHNDFIEYEFLSPWLALNQKNLIEYKKADEEEKINVLGKVLIGNILACSKSLNYTVYDELKVGLDLKETNVNLKDQKMIGFKGRFCVNFKLPDYIGIGKSCSKGFGIVKQL